MCLLVAHRFFFWVLLFYLRRLNACRTTSFSCTIYVNFFSWPNKKKLKNIKSVKLQLELLSSSSSWHIFVLINWKCLEILRLLHVPRNDISNSFLNDENPSLATVIQVRVIYRRVLRCVNSTLCTNKWKNSSRHRIKARTDQETCLRQSHFPLNKIKSFEFEQPKESTTISVTLDRLDARNQCEMIV